MSKKIVNEVSPKGEQLIHAYFDGELREKDESKLLDLDSRLMQSEKELLDLLKVGFSCWNEQEVAGIQTDETWQRLERRIKKDQILSAQNMERSYFEKLGVKGSSLLQDLRAKVAFIKLPSPQFVGVLS